MKNEDVSRVQRISEMEKLYREGREAIDRLLYAIERYTEAEDKIKKLEEYYTGKLWLSDYDADSKGLLPRDMKRGILAQDTVYDLLTDRERLMAVMKKMTENT